MVIRKVRILPCARLVAAIYLAWGLLAGVGVFIASVAGLPAAPGGSDDLPGWMGGLFGPAAIVVLPLLYGLLGYLGAALACWVFNRAAATLGGLEIEVE